MKRIVPIVLFIAATGLFILNGCREVQMTDASAPVTGDTLKAECVASYFKTNTSPYITQQQHRFSPSAGLLRVIADEPLGRYESVLQQEQFAVLGEPPVASADLPETFFNKALATAVFYSMCGGGALLDPTTMTAGQPVKILGQWFIPLTPTWPRNELSVTLFQNQHSLRIEWVNVSDPANGLEWMALNFNLRYNSDLARRLPRTVDIYDVRDGIASKKTIVRFEYNDILSNSIKP